MGATKKLFMDYRNNDGMDDADLDYDYFNYHKNNN